jgi:hypothetical protein
MKYIFHKTVQARRLKEKSLNMDGYNRYDQNCDNIELGPTLNR